MSTREKLLATIEIASSDTISLRTLMNKAGGSAKLKAMDQKAAATALKQAAGEIKAERVKAGSKAATKFESKEVIDWVRKNCPTASSKRKDMNEPKPKPKAKKVVTPDEPADAVHTDAEEKQWFDEMKLKQKSPSLTVRMDSAVFYLGIDGKTAKDGSHSGSIDPSLVKKWLPKAMKDLGFKAEGDGKYTMPTGETLFIGKDTKGNIKYKLSPGNEGSSPKAKHGVVKTVKDIVTEPETRRLPTKEALQKTRKYNKIIAEDKEAARLFRELKKARKMYNDNNNTYNTTEVKEGLKEKVHKAQDVLRTYLDSKN